MMNYNLSRLEHICNYDTPKDAFLAAYLQPSVQPAVRLKVESRMSKVANFC